MPTQLRESDYSTNASPPVYSKPRPVCPDMLNNGLRTTTLQAKLNRSTKTTTTVPTATLPLARKLRVAVVGSGLAGLTIAHLLSSLHEDNGQGDQGIDVELFEKAHKLEYYPALVRLYRSIGVKFHDADNTLSCFDVTFDNTSACRSTSNVNIETPYLSSRSYRVSADHTITLPDLPPLSILNPYPFGRRLLGYYRIARDYVKMLTVSKEFMTQGRMMEIGKDPSEWGNGRQVSLREFLVSGGYSHDFSAFFVPLFACVCTCSFDRMMEYPACVVLEYVARCMPFGRMQFVTSGVQEVTENLSKNINTIHYNTMIEKIIQAEPGHGEEKGPVVLVDSHGVRRTFDHVIFATQANQAAATLAGQRASKPLPKPFVTSRETDYDESNYGRREEHDLTDPETPRDVDEESIPKDHPFYDQIQTLSKFPYERTQVVCHTDTSFLPKDPGAWRLLNIAKSTTADILASPLDRVTAELEMQEQGLEPSAITTALEQEQVGTKNRKSNQSSASSSSFGSRTQSGSSTPNSTTASQSHNSAMATHIMNNTASSLGSTTKFLQTTNPIFQPKPDSVISSAWFERAVVNPESIKAVDELDRQMDAQAERLTASSKDSPSDPASVSDRVWFVGSYAYPGIPLLEGCVVSAVQVMERIVSTEPLRQLAALTTAAESSSFLKRDAPMRERRLRRKHEQERQQQEAALLMKKGYRPPTASEVYFKNAWKDTLEDERIWEEQEQKGHTDRSLNKDDERDEWSTTVGSRKKKTAAVGSWTSNVYVEVGWMLVLYLAAIVQWWMVFLLESAGVDGSRWALA
ncbi:hypothetical protein EMPS_04916 [Entomortierella parvispora]|uniref:Amine oxidase domain-containing protein n=1 Tax=Entomortierella parvispora TaxID=205924 RepID=A0A9P3HA27_9FUNG|nr:hypothetical protein EMPS_04916 [Entomortierella parvispora]